jgi:hypothetical protein
MATLEIGKLKRIHLFEFEDYSWFPNWLRICMTRYLNAFHKILGTSEVLAGLLADVINQTQRNKILDLCSGSGGPMIDVVHDLREKHNLKDITLSLSDLYPNLKAAGEINMKSGAGIKYITESVNATNINKDMDGIRTMVCSMHHMKPEVAQKILKGAKESQQPICIYEISDNSAPIAIWWVAIPFAFLMVFFITPIVRPMTWQQLVFTYLIPLIPLFIAWDGAVSNARTYTIEDMSELIKGLESETYKWEMGTIPGRGGKKVFLKGTPAN